MEITYAGLSSQGPVRTNNEDCLDYWQPNTPQDWRTRGAVAILADGVGGHGHGEVASRLAVDQCRAAFTEGKAGASASQFLWEMFNSANVAVYDAGMKQRMEGRMLTTLTVSVFRNNEVTIGHVGDCRVYAIQGGRIRRVTSDHSYAGVQVKLGLITVQDAMNSSLRSVLTRSVGQDPIIRIDTETVTVNRGDYIVQCTDGLWCSVTEQEIFDIVTRRSPEEACRELIDVVTKRGGDDNLTIQVVRIESVERLSYYRGLPTYRKVESASMGNELEVGQLLDERFQVTDLIARSGMASIFKANDLKTQRTVALKVPFMRFESDPGFFSRFKREEQIGKTLNHPYILRFEDTPENQSRPYIVMEFLEGQTLGHLMRSVRPMPTNDALRIASRICEALHYMHEHEVVHRDLKPENIMVCNDGTIRVMDFGIAKYEGMRRLTFGGFTPAMGTPDYMAPEQVKGKRGDPRTDIFSLGAILYEMLTGSVPYEGANPFLIMNARLSGDPVAPRQRNAELTPQVEEIILHAMARNPAERYQTALEMKHDLDNPEKVEVTGRAARLEAPAAWKSRWWGGRRLVLIAVAVLAIGFGIYKVLGHIQWK
ncbi:MAG TPA: protein kinase [Tepidisphaeraceae bacterium]|jgi:serine/threonine-protein kinase|nr:protein kinase [Tepidisphaeraceae bacterium]